MSTAHQSSVAWGGSPVVQGSLASKRSRKRQAGRERIHERVVHPIDTPHLMRDPLEHRESKTLSAITGVRLLVAAGIIHGLVIVGFALVSRVVGEPRVFKEPERLKVSIVEPPKVEPPPVVEPPKVEGPVEPEFVPPTPPKRVEAPPQKPKSEPPAPVADPSPEPVQRRVVGLSLESTVEGTGPSFATGSTRMGTTENRATDPNAAKRASSGPAAAAPSVSDEKGPAQRVATRIPTRDAQFENPKRIRPNKPEFPATLKAQNIEGDVMVSVDIAPSGAVTRVSIVRSSNYPAFDEAARRAAQAERFAPATRDGQAVAFTLTYTYRFRIED